MSQHSKDRTAGRTLVCPARQPSVQPQESAFGGVAMQLEALQGLPMNRLFVETAQIADLQKWAAARGVPVAKSRQCLSNTAEINRVMRMTNGAIETFPEFRGTPAFILNGTLLTESTWDQLEPKLRDALGERG